ncbi:MAG TPA: Nramp family divalent metal transporter [Deinococcales bacterium]|nr:Nramp family divalent metal transporter [Deinococcales bacterium]
MQTPDERSEPIKRPVADALGEASLTPGEERKSLLATLGPGLVTGAADDDPSGIATYSQVGAAHGYNLLWTMLFAYPLMAAVQEISARVGRVSGRGLAGNMRRHYPGPILSILIAAVLAANVINLGADIGAMGASFKLIVGGPSLLWAALFAILSTVLQVFVPYSRYVSVLKWLTLALFAYVATVLAVRVDWGAALRGTIIPNLGANPKAAVVALVATLGTTISPYLFFWQASMEVEETQAAPDEEPLKKAPEQAPEQIHRIKVDTYFGMAVSNVIAFFIILTAAATLHARGITQIDSAATAAKALQPVAGALASGLFTVGIVGTGLLALPVLAGSGAYALGELLRWPVGLERKPLAARGFYSVIAVSTLGGLALNFSPIDPIQALYWSAVINGVVAAPVMAMLMLVANNPKVMGRFTLSPRLKAFGWLATAVMLAAAVALFALGS